MNDYYHIVATREQVDYADKLCRMGIAQKVGTPGSSLGLGAAFSGVLGETVTKDAFGIMRSSYREADNGVDFTLHGKNVDVKTSNFNPNVPFFEGVVFLKKDWLDYSHTKATDILLFVGHDKRKNVLHYFGWLTVDDLRSGVDTGEVRIVGKNQLIKETQNVAACDTLIIPRVSMRRFGSVVDFSEQVLEMATKPERKAETPLPAATPPSAQAKQIKAEQKPNSEPPKLSVLDYGAFEARMDDLTTVFTVVCRDAMTASRIRTWLTPAKTEDVTLEVKASKSGRAFKTCYYCASGFNRYAAGRPPWREVCSMEACQERLQRDKKNRALTG